jgi:hypothetical protein
LTESKTGLSLIEEDAEDAADSSSGEGSNNIVETQAIISPYTEGS